MLFSVIVPVYNCERYLEDALKSVLGQEFSDYEIVVVDDGSTDGSGQIADLYAHKHDRVKVLHGTNEGLLLARRKGLLHAAGEYVLFLDADDLFRNGAFGRIAQEIEATGADIVAFRLSRDRSFLVSADERNALGSGLYVDNNYMSVKEHVCRGRFNNLAGKAIRLACIDIKTSYREHAGLMHGEDLFQLLPVINNANSLVELDEALYYYRPNASSSTACYKASQLADIVRVNRRLLEYAGRWGGDCPAHAAQGEANQYFYLLKMSELLNVGKQKKRLIFKEIGKAMVDEGTFSRLCGVSMRPDNRVLAFCLENGWYAMARLTVRLVEVLKRWLGSPISR